jgi:hypothetical protein
MVKVISWKIRKKDAENVRNCNAWMRLVWRRVHLIQ